MGELKANQKLTRQQYEFAYAYTQLKGSKRTFTNAALEAGVPKDLAHVYGYKWSKLPAVRDYWNSVQQSLIDRHKMAIDDTMSKAIDMLYDQVRKKSEELSPEEKIKLIDIILNAGTVKSLVSDANKGIAEDVDENISSESKSTFSNLAESLESLFNQISGNT